MLVPYRAQTAGRNRSCFVHKSHSIHRGRGRHPRSLRRPIDRERSVHASLFRNSPTVQLSVRRQYRSAGCERLLSIVEVSWVEIAPNERVGLRATNYAPPVRQACLADQRSADRVYEDAAVKSGQRNLTPADDSNARVAATWLLKWDALPRTASQDARPDAVPATIAPTILRHDAARVMRVELRDAAVARIAGDVGYRTSLGIAGGCKRWKFHDLTLLSCEQKHTDQEHNTERHLGALNARAGPDGGEA